MQRKLTLITSRNSLEKLLFWNGNKEQVLGVYYHFMSLTRTLIMENYASLLGRFMTIQLWEWFEMNGRESRMCFKDAVTPQSVSLCFILSRVDCHVSRWLMILCKEDRTRSNRSSSIQTETVICKPSRCLTGGLDKGNPDSNHCPAMWLATELC